MSEFTRVPNKGSLSENSMNLNQILLHASRLIVGLVFVFSGFVKVVDPLGLTYKIEDYLMAFGGIFTSLTFLATAGGIILPAIELLIGLNLLFMIQLRRTSFVAFVLMLCLTPLTLYIAIFNPVTDCGCFGDALLISNWTTFGKNVVLLILVIILLFTTKNKKSFLLAKFEYVILALFFGIGIGISTYALTHLPPIDFRPYKIGTNIPESMFVPNDAPLDVYKTSFIYKKNGVEKEFTLEDYPKNDSTWTFVDQKTKLVSTGYKAPIHDFSIVDANYNDITEDVIYDKGYTYLLVMYDINKASKAGAKQAEIIYNKYKNSSTKFYALTASSDDDIHEFVKRTGVTFPFCKTDPITLKTIVRANPGLVLIKNGVIMNKWHWRDF